MMSQAARPICDYEGSAYRTEFWGQGREYEDAVERVAFYVVPSVVAFILLGELLVAGSSGWRCAVCCRPLVAA